MTRSDDPAIRKRLGSPGEKARARAEAAASAASAAVFGSPIAAADRIVAAGPARSPPPPPPPIAPAARRGRAHGRRDLERVSRTRPPGLRPRSVCGQAEVGGENGVAACWLPADTYRYVISFVILGVLFALNLAGPSCGQSAGSTTCKVTRGPTFCYCIHEARGYATHHGLMRTLRDSTKRERETTRLLLPHLGASLVSPRDLTR